MTKIAIIQKLQGFYDRIDRIHQFTRYTVNECEQIARSSKDLLLGAACFPDEKLTAALQAFDTVIGMADRYRDTGRQYDPRSVRKVLIEVKGGLELLLFDE